MDGLTEGIRELTRILKVETGDQGIPLEVIRRPGPLEVSLENGIGRIQYEEKIHFFRGLGLFVEHASGGRPFAINERPRFTFHGAMLDVSRNAVPTTDTVRHFLRIMALMGLNGLMLYAEDTYEIENRPYFGYMRGRYTARELMACDDYADLFGIEIVPCIQTLSHMAQVLKWDEFAPVRDGRDTLLPGEPETYRLIEDMIAAASAPFRSKRIHIGMDEAFGVGLGRYLAKHGYKPRFSVMMEHLEQVLRITRRNQLQPMIWSDMIFHFLSDNEFGFHYDLNADFSSEKLALLPKDVQFVYWDYGQRDQSVYERCIDKHRELGSTPLFAGGIHAWGSMSPNNGKTWMITNPALLACKKSGVKEVIATVWGDNGQETNHFAVLPGLQLFAEHGYADDCSDESLRRRFLTCTGTDLFDDMIDLKRMDEVPGVEPGNHFMANPSKYLLWQDPLLGLFDKHVEGAAEQKLPNHYAALRQRWSAVKEAAPFLPLYLLFEQYEALSAVLSVKSTVGLDIARLYKAGDKSGLRTIASSRLPELQRLTEALRAAHRRLWMATYKPFGWEVLDIRYGGLSARISSAIERIFDYVEGRADKLEELEAERLPFGDTPPDSPVTINSPLYHRIVTASCFSE